MTKHIVLFIGVSLLAVCAKTASSQDKEKPKEEKTVRVKFVLGSPPFHDIRKLPPILIDVMREIGRFKITTLAPPKDEKPDDKEHLEKLAGITRSDCDVMVFYTTGYQLNEAQERAIENYVESGGGVVALHGASASFTNSKVWNRLLGGKFAGHVPGTHKLSVVITDPKHPITTGINEFTVLDEEYNHHFADVKRHVVAKFKSRPRGSKGKNMDIVWTREVGKGRVVYIALGHGRDTWSHPSWQKMTIQAILWAANQSRPITIPKRK